MITVKNTLADVVRIIPRPFPFFNELHLDYCFAAVGSLWKKL